MIYLLDTDIVSYALKGHGAVRQHITGNAQQDLAVSSITLAELRLGAELKHSSRINSLINVFIESVNVASFDERAALEFGRLAAMLTKAGTPIGNFDTLIASHAISLDCILVTNNTKHFSRVPGLVIENWT